MKKLIQKWLEKLAKANEKNLGSGPLDCCELNKDDKVKSPNNKKTTDNKNLKNKRN